MAEVAAEVDDELLTLIPVVELEVNGVMNNASERRRAAIYEVKRWLDRFLLAAT